MRKNNLFVNCSLFNDKQSQKKLLESTLFTFKKGENNQLIKEIKISHIEKIKEDFQYSLSQKAEMQLQNEKINLLHQENELEIELSNLHNEENYLQQKENELNLQENTKNKKNREGLELEIKYIKTGVKKIKSTIETKQENIKKIKINIEKIKLEIVEITERMRKIEKEKTISLLNYCLFVDNKLGDNFYTEQLLKDPFIAKKLTPAFISEAFINSIKNETNCFLAFLILQNKILAETISDQVLHNVCLQSEEFCMLVLQAGKGEHYTISSSLIEKFGCYNSDQLQRITFSLRESNPFLLQTYDMDKISGNCWVELANKWPSAKQYIKNHYQDRLSESQIDNLWPKYTSSYFNFNL